MAVTFSATTEYTPYQNVVLIKDKHKDKDCGCGGKKDCDECNECSPCSKDKDCSCCKSGTVQVKDGNGEGVGCLSMPDAYAYYNGGGYQCEPGYVQVFIVTEVIGTIFTGCMSQEQYNAYVAAGYIANGILFNTHV